MEKSARSVAYVSCSPMHGSARILEKNEQCVDPFFCKDAPFIVQYVCDTAGVHAIPCQTREEAEKTIAYLNERAKEGPMYKWSMSQS